MKIYTIAIGRRKIPSFFLTGKWIDNGPGKPASVECASILRAKRYKSREEIDADPMTHTEGFWETNTVNEFDETEFAMLEEKKREELAKERAHMLSLQQA